MANDLWKFDKRLAIVQLPDEKPVLVRLTVDKKGLLGGIVQNDHAGSAPDILAVSSANILTLLSSKHQHTGTVFGQKIEPWVSMFKVPKWGIFNVFREDFSDQDKKVLLRVLLKRLNKFRKQFGSMLLPLNFEIRPNTSKMVGNYRIIKKGDDQKEILTLMLSDMQSIEDLVRVFCHEFGHPIWSKYLNSQQRSSWIKRYSASNQIDKLSPSDLEQIKSELITSGESVSKFRRAQEDKHKIIFDTILRYIKDKHHLDIKFLNELRESGDDLSRYWPKTEQQISEINAVLTDYAKKDPMEYFCEAFSLHCSGEKLPEKDLKLMKKTINNLVPSKQEN